MDREKKLNLAEIHTILKLNEEHYSVTKMVKTVDRSDKTTMNLLKNPDNCAKIKNCGRLQYLAAQDKRAIIRTVSNSSLTPR